MKHVTFQSKGEQKEYVYTEITTATHIYHNDEIKIDNFKWIQQGLNHHKTSKQAYNSI